MGIQLSEFCYENVEEKNYDDKKTFKSVTGSIMIDGYYIHYTVLSNQWFGSGSLFSGIMKGLSDSDLHGTNMNPGSSYAKCGPTSLRSPKSENPRFKKITVFNKNFKSQFVVGSPWMKNQFIQRHLHCLTNWIFTEFCWYSCNILGFMISVIVNV